MELPKQLHFSFDYINYLLSHKDKRMISTNRPVTPPDRNEPTSADMLVITSVPNQQLPNTTVDRIEIDTKPVKTPAIPPNTSPIEPKIDFIFIVFPPIIIVYY